MQNKDERVEDYTNFMQIMQNVYDHVKNQSFANDSTLNRVNVAFPTLQL